MAINKNDNEIIKKLTANIKRINAFMAGFVPAGTSVMLQVGKAPCTNGKVVYLPTQLVMEFERRRSLIMGFILHELGHVIFTSFKETDEACKKLSKKLVKKLQPKAAGPLSEEKMARLCHDLFNVMEDPRIEASMEQEAQSGNELFNVTHQETDNVTVENGANPLLSQSVSRLCCLRLICAIAQGVNTYRDVNYGANAALILDAMKSKVPTGNFDTFSAYSAKSTVRAAIGKKDFVPSNYIGRYVEECVNNFGDYFLNDLLVDSKQSSSQMQSSGLSSALQELINSTAQEQQQDEKDDEDKKAEKDDGKKSGKKSEKTEDGSESSETTDKGENQSQQNGTGSKGSGDQKADAEKDENANSGSQGSNSGSGEQKGTDSSSADADKADTGAAGGSGAGSISDILDAMRAADSTSQEVLDAVNRQILQDGEGVLIQSSVKELADLSNLKKLKLSGVDRLQRYIREPVKNRNIQRELEAFLDANGALVAKVSQGLRQELVGLDKRIATQRARHGARVHRSNIAKIANNVLVNTPFAARAVNEVMNTHIAMICDVSGSMRGDKYRLMMQSLCIIGKALAKYESNRCRFSVIGFDSELTLVKPYTEKFSVAGLSKMPDAHDSTEGAKAAKLALNELMYSRQDRKILIALTDGSWDVSDPELYQQLKRSGVEVYGLMIGQKYFINTPDFTASFHIDHAEKLPDVLCRLFKSVLHESRQTRRRSA
ncbi:MAG TPA: hypothetical protein DCR21_03915 [Succinivibrionaceae bacterium]|nr:hypothetical protein [Succinivibrionaceae bacterium]